MLDLNEEKKLFGQGYKLIGGIDEAGRGPLAGPVVAACVVINSDFKISGILEKINDSKKLTAKLRELLFKAIKDNFIEFGIGICDRTTIDRINILQASFLAMKKALGSIKAKPDLILVDGKLEIPNCSLPQKAVVNGDQKIFSIAAASIMAKVTRDRIMEEMHQKYPLYGFNQHKGYGTKEHLENLKLYGPCAIHRLSFKPIKNKFVSC